MIDWKKIKKYKEFIKKYIRKLESEKEFKEREKVKMKIKIEELKVKIEKLN